MRTFRDRAARLYDWLAAISHARFILGLAILALLPRIAAVVAGGNFSNPELYETGIIAQNILHGNGYAMYTGFPFPGIPLRKRSRGQAGLHLRPLPFPDMLRS